jgi:hypothetical protein
MNGLPGMFGSGMPETYETVRLLEFLQQSFARVARVDNSCALELPVEVSDFYQILLTLSRAYNARAGTSCSTTTTSSSSVISLECQSLNFQFWNQSNTHREEYLQRVSYSGYFSGEKVTYRCPQIAEDLSVFLQKLRDGISRSMRTQQEAMGATHLSEVVPPTYYSYTVTSIQYILPPGSADNSTILYLPAGFSQQSLPLFLEGATRMLKITSDVSEKRQLYHAVTHPRPSLSSPSHSRLRLLR